VSDDFRTLAKLLREEVKGPVHARLYLEARDRHAVLEPYPDLASLMAMLAENARREDYAERDAITLALLRERAEANASQWSSVLSVVYLPMLLRLRRQLVCAELPSDDLDQLVLESFLVAIASYRPTWRGRTPIRLTHLTRRRVFKTLRKELNQRRGRDDHRTAIRMCPDRVPAGCASSPPVGFTLDRVLETLADHVSEEGAFLVRETEFGTDTLHMVVDRLEPRGGQERERLYQRLKRIRSRAKKRLRDAIVAAR